MSDGDLVARPCLGKTERMKSSCAGGLRRILAVCHGRVGRRDVAEDLAQETLLRGYRSLGRCWNPRSSPAG